MMVNKTQVIKLLVLLFSFSVFVIISWGEFVKGYGSFWLNMVLALVNLFLAAIWFFHDGPLFDSDFEKDDDELSVYGWFKSLRGERI